MLFSGNLQRTITPFPAISRSTQSSPCSITCPPRLMTLAIVLFLQVSLDSELSAGAVNILAAFFVSRAFFSCAFSAAKQASLFLTSLTVSLGEMVASHCETALVPKARASVAAKRALFIFCHPSKKLAVRQIDLRRDDQSLPERAARPSRQLPGRRTCHRHAPEQPH